MKMLRKFILSLSIVCCLCVNQLAGIVCEDVPIIPSQLNIVGNRKGTVALAAIFQNEAQFLKEWIEYHRMIGVSHFYLYNNLSNDGYLGILKPYLEQGIVELFDVPFDSSLMRDGAVTHNFVQVCCYNHALEIAKSANKWLVVIDTDEFVCPMQSRNLVSFLRNYRGVGGVVAYWQIFGTSGIWDIGPGELLIDKLTHKYPQNYDENWQFKSIVRTKYAEGFYDPHCCKYIEGKFSISPNYQMFRHGKPYPEIPVDTLRINHYTFRTESFYQKVKKPRKAMWGFVPSPEHEEEFKRLSNSVEDLSMQRFVERLKIRVFLK